MRGILHPRAGEGRKRVIRDRPRGSVGAPRGWALVETGMRAEGECLPASVLRGLRRRATLLHVDEQNPPEESQQGPNIIMPPEEFAGKWANAASIARTPHEFTLDFLRIGPQGQQGIVVSRVSFSPLLASQLVDLLNEQWQAYTQESGVPTEDNGDD